MYKTPAIFFFVRLTAWGGLYGETGFFHQQEGQLVLEMSRNKV